MNHRATKKILVIVGTRADAIKMLPVYQALKESPRFEVQLVSTGQHLEILQDVLDSFGVQPDIRFSVMVPGQGLSGLVTALIKKLDTTLKRKKPDLVLVHGDTATGFAAGMAAFYNQVAVGHVEAGLRTGRLDTPFPEEFHRRTLAMLASFHFAKDSEARANLIKEGIEPGSIHVVGQSGADAVVRVLSQQKQQSVVGRELKKTRLLMTLHRRETGAVQQTRILDGIAKLAREFGNLEVVYPLRPDPSLIKLVRQRLGGISNIQLKQPLPFGEFLRELTLADIVLTDSGGIQEESVMLGKKVLLAREQTERSDGLANGQVEVLGTDPEPILQKLRDNLIQNPKQIHSAGVRAGASAKISRILEERLHHVGS